MKDPRKRQPRAVAANTISRDLRADGHRRHSTPSVHAQDVGVGGFRAWAHHLAGGVVVTYQPARGTPSRNIIEERRIALPAWADSLRARGYTVAHKGDALLVIAHSWDLALLHAIDQKVQRIIKPLGIPSRDGPLMLSLLISDTVTLTITVAEQYATVVLHERHLRTDIGTARAVTEVVALVREGLAQGLAR